MEQKLFTSLSIGDLETLIINCVVGCLKHHKPQPTDPTTDPDELLTVRGAAEFLTLSVPTIYALISKSELPVIKRGKRCYFLKVDLMAWLKQGRRKTNTEIAAEVKAYQKRKGASHE